MSDLGRNMKDGDTVEVTGSRSVSGKVRRRRTVYSRSHLDLLLKTFESNPYPGISLREKLSQLTGIHESRIQVWFQNRRARKNKKKEPENEHVEWRQCDQLPQVSQTQHKREVYKIGHNEKYGHINNNYALPFPPLSHLHMNSVVCPRYHNYVWPKHCQATTSVSSTHPTGQYYHPYMQQVSSSPLQQPTCILETSSSDYSTDFDNSPEPDVGATQELSLQDILEEFQPCWTDVANNFSDLTDDLL